MRHLAILFACMLAFTHAEGRDPDKKYTRQEYIDLWKKVAVENMRQYHIPASIILAQGILESSCGNSDLATQANNHFGIKCHDWTGDKYYYDDDAKQECFRKYRQAHESYADHALFLTNRPRYASLFQLDPQDYKAWAHGLKKAGYATNPAYAELLIKIIDDSKLHRFDSGFIEEAIELPQEQPIASVGSKTKKTESSKTRKEAVTINLEREILSSENRIKYIEARSGDSPHKIAKELNLNLWQILKYNDIDRTAKLKAGQVVYLQPKRRKAKIERHVMKKGENLWEISQMYGIKLSRIYKLNELRENARVPEGFVLKLR
ncbi:MAG TPA: glucosaminidase domain-containing protein [Luteibaculaceae bacterium]|nr:glucosaminidase domain-containing protein [Luteibaculaceae bacterium]